MTSLYGGTGWKNGGTIICDRGFGRKSSCVLQKRSPGPRTLTRAVQPDSGDLFKVFLGLLFNKDGKHVALLTVMTTKITGYTQKTYP